MKNKLLDFAALLLSLIVFAIDLILLGEFHGYWRGMLDANGIRPGQKIEFITHGPNFFDSMAFYYSILAILVFLSILIGRVTIIQARIVAVLLLSGALAFYVSLLRFKYDIHESTLLSYRDILNNSVGLDWFCIAFISLTSAIYAYLLISSARKSHEAD